MILWKNDPAYLLNADNLHKSIADIIDFSGGSIYPGNQARRRNWKLRRTLRLQSTTMAHLRYLM